MVRIVDWAESRNEIRHGILVEVPGVGALKVVHGKDVIRTIVIHEELHGDRGCESSRILAQVLCLRESHDDGVGATLIDACVASVYSFLCRRPSHLGYDSLRVNRLHAVSEELIRGTAEALEG